MASAYRTALPTMTIRVTNATFESASPGEFDSLDDAYRAPLRSGLEIAAGEVSAGSISSIVQVSVDLVGQIGAVRGAVAVSSARLLGPGPA